MQNNLSYYYYYTNNGASTRLQIKDQMTQQDQQQFKMRRVQVVYYLSRNGQLEHPHFMEVLLSSPNHHNLRLRDVLDRLSALRGRDMPALYSWSCKRSYKHGYVWNDLAENDVIYPTQGAEYVLKGSELPRGCTEKFGAIQVRAPEFEPEQKQSRVVKSAEAEKMEEEEDGNSSCSFSTNTPPSRCSIGISTDDMQIIPSESTTSSSASDKPFEPGRSSVLLQLIACGSSTIGLRNRCRQKPKTLTGIKDETKLVVTACEKRAEDEADGDVAMIKCMSENPRFGGFQTEKKEYFSGSIVEAVAAEERVGVEPSQLNRSNSFGEERKRSEAELEEERIAEEEVKTVVTGKCMPRGKKKPADH